MSSDELKQEALKLMVEIQQCQMEDRTWITPSGMGVNATYAFAVGHAFTRLINQVDDGVANV